MSRVSRFSLSSLFAAILAVAVTSTASFAQSPGSYPTKPVRVIVPYTPGGATTAVTRIFTQKFTESWGQQVILENMAGGNTIIGSQAGARAPADGHTILMVTSTHSINPWLQAKLPYDTLKDFAAISTMTRSDYMLAAHPGLPANNLKEFIAYARANPGKINSATVGLGTIQHLVNELLMDAAGIQMTIVPYKGGGPSTTDLLGGQVQVSMNNLLNYASHLRSGKLKGIGISGDRRNPVMPDLPTFSEQGLKGYVATNWFALLFPAGVARDLVQKVNTEVARAQASRDVQDNLAKQGIDPFPSSVAETEALIRTDMARYGKVIKDKNIKAEGD
jgi:tripartite-type tricarboxylate transporter receptor subunit TctC